MVEFRTQTHNFKSWILLWLSKLEIEELEKPEKRGGKSDKMEKITESYFETQKGGKEDKDDKVGQHSA